MFTDYLLLMKKFLKNKKISIPVAVVLLIVIFSIGNGGKDEEIYVVSKGDFVQETRVSGKVTPLDEAILSFNTSGRVGEVFHDVGDQVKRGDVLASLDRNDLNARLSEAQANLLLEQRQLGELEVGTREEEIAVSRVKVESATQEYDDSLNNLVLSMRQSYTAATSLFNNDISQLFDNPFALDAKIIPTMNARNREKINEQYYSVYLILNKWSDLNSRITATSYNANDLSVVQDNLNILREYASLVSIAVSDFEPANSITQADIDGYKSDLSSGRTALDSAITALANASEDFDSAGNTLRLEESNLALLESGATQGDLRIQEAKIAAGSARVQSALAELEDSKIVAPFDGVIAKKSIDVGGNVNSDTEAFVLVAENGMEIESYIPELLIRNVTQEDPAKITFDAYPDKKFNGVVTSVDSKDTLKDGVTTYKTLLQINDLDDTAVRIGMTVDILIEAFRKPDVILVPSRAIFTGEDGEKYVMVSKKKVAITTGERDSHGNREVLSGLEEGDKVILNPES